MPDWIFKLPQHEKSPRLTNAAGLAVAAARAAGSRPQLLNLPPNYSYITDGQSYHDAASNNVTGAWAMLHDSFGKAPGAGETITNISLGTIDDTSTVVENGQRYLEQSGYPKIPVWLSSQQCTPTGGSGASCSVILDPTATNTDDGQGDLGEVMLDFSVMAPPPRGDSRVPHPQAADQLGEILGAAYGANFRLINPLVNGTPDFFAAWLGAGFLQTPAPTVVTASIGDGFPFGFSDNFFEEEAMIHDIVSILVNGQDIFVTISAGDGQTDTNAAMNPNGIIGAANVTTNPAQVVDLNDPNAWVNPNYSYGLTFEPQFLIDSGANSAGGDALNDVFNNAPWNRRIDRTLRHNQHTTETRWTGQQNFHSGNGSRTNVAAPADDVLYLAQVEDATGTPVDPFATEPELVGGTSASCPEIAAAAALLRQAAALLGHPLSARATRDLLVASGRDNQTPTFDLNAANVGKVLDVTRAMEMLFAQAGVSGRPIFERMTVAQRKAIPYSNGYGRGFYTDTPQDPTARTAMIDLSQGLIAPTSFNNETSGPSGNNLNAPITFGVDAAYLPLNATFRWSFAYGGKTAGLARAAYDPSQPYIRLLPIEIFDLLGQPTTAAKDRVVAVTVRSSGLSLTTKVTFKGQSDATYTHAVPPSFNPLFQPSGPQDGVSFRYDLRGLRDDQGVPVDGGVLIVSDIDRILPRAFSDRDADAHGFKIALNGLTGTVTVAATDLPHGVGTYGIALRGSQGGTEAAGSTSSWLPLRYAPKLQAIPRTPTVLAEGGFGGTVPRFYDIADFEAGGSTKFKVAYDVTAVPGAKGAIIELSAPAVDLFKSVFITSSVDIPLVNNFTNPSGDRLDAGNNLMQPGSVFHKAVSSAHGIVTLDAHKIGLAIPAGACDSAYQVRVFATDSSGKIIGVASNPSVIDYGDLSAPACAP